MAEQRNPLDPKGSKYAGKRTDSITEWPDDLQREAYELLLETCMGQIAEQYTEVYAEKAMGEACRQIASLIRAQMTPRHLESNTLEPHGLALRLLELYEQAYNGLRPDGTPDPSIFGLSDS